MRTITAWPTDNDRVTLDFAATSRPYSQTNQHKGIDLAPVPGASLGANLYCWLDGVVRATGFHASAGNYIIWQSELPEDGAVRDLAGLTRVLPKGTKVETHYYHLMENSIYTYVGDNIKAGMRIGRIGNSGYSFGAHLHWEVRVMNTDVQRDVIDPMMLYHAMPKETTNSIQLDDGWLLRGYRVDRETKTTLVRLDDTNKIIHVRRD